MFTKKTTRKGRIVDERQLSFLSILDNFDTRGAYNDQVNEYFADLVKEQYPAEMSVSDKRPLFIPDQLTKIGATESQIVALAEFVLELQGLLWKRFEKLKTFMSLGYVKDVKEMAIWIFAPENRKAPFSFDMVARNQGHDPDLLREGLGNEYPALLECAERFVAYARSREQVVVH